MIKVIDVINDALQLLGRADVAEAYDAGTLTDEQNRIVAALLHCYNSVEDELARSCFPLVKEETVTVTDGKLYYTKLSRTPVKVLGVTVDGKKVKHWLTPEYININAYKAAVKYSFYPEKKSLEDDGDYNGITVSQRLMAYGVAAEYCLIQGNYDDSESFESKYKLAIEAEHRLTPPRRYIPPRSWI